MDDSNTESQKLKKVLLNLQNSYSTSFIIRIKTGQDSENQKCVKFLVNYGSIIAKQLFTELQSNFSTVCINSSGILQISHKQFESYWSNAIAVLEIDTPKIDLDLINKYTKILVSYLLCAYICHYYFNIDPHIFGNLLEIPSENLAYEAFLNLCTLFKEEQYGLYLKNLSPLTIQAAIQQYKVNRKVFPTWNTSSYPKKFTHHHAGYGTDEERYNTISPMSRYTPKQVLSVENTGYIIDCSSLACGYSANVIYVNPKSRTLRFISEKGVKNSIPLIVYGFDSNAEINNQSIEKFLRENAEIFTQLGLPTAPPRYMTGVYIIIKEALFSKGCFKHGVLNPSGSNALTAKHIKQAINSINIAPQHFSPITVHILLRVIKHGMTQEDDSKFEPNQLASFGDFFGGWGDRLSGALSCQQFDRILVSDINPNLEAGYKKITEVALKSLNNHGCSLPKVEIVAQSARELVNSFKDTALNRPKLDIICIGLPFGKPKNYNGINYSKRRNDDYVSWVADTADILADMIIHVLNPGGILVFNLGDDAQTSESNIECILNKLENSEKPVKSYFTGGIIKVRMVHYGSNQFSVLVILQRTSAEVRLSPLVKLEKL